MFPRILSGSLLLYRMVDVADDIDLRQAEGALRGEGGAPRVTSAPFGRQAGRNAPVAMGLGPRAVVFKGARLDLSAFVRIFSHGVVSIRYELPLPSGSGAAEVAALLRRTAEDDALEQEARREAARVLQELGTAVHGPHADATVESYSVVFATEIEAGMPASSIEGEDLARVLLGEPPAMALSDQTVAHATRHRFAYGRSDLCVLDWDSAFVLEPSGDRAVADVLEVATTQLLELRHYDAVFERELLHVADELRRPGRHAPWRRARAYRALARRVQRLVVESAEVVERTENAVHFTGDLYLARVHRAAVERFRIEVWQASVLRRQETAAHVAELLHSDANARLGHVLEGSILALIVLEIVMAVLRIV